MPEIEPEFLREVRTMYPEFEIRERRSMEIDRWSMILVLRILRLVMVTLPLDDDLRSLSDKELGDMQLLLRGDLTMAEFASRYPEYQEGSPDGGD